MISLEDKSEFEGIRSENKRSFHSSFYLIQQHSGKLLESEETGIEEKSKLVAVLLLVIVMVDQNWADAKLE